MKFTSYFFTGVCLIVLSGIEKIAIYLVLAKQTGNNIQTLINIIPSYIWNITNITFAAGIFFIALALSLLFLEIKKRQGRLSQK